MPVEADELYCNLNKLLFDICKFLQDETNYEKLSPAARKQADELIGRSKRQLQEITKIVKENNEYDGAYVDMERKPAENSEDDDDSENIYTPVDESIPPKPTVITNLQTENPYSNLPAKELSQEIKYGPLSWRCRFFFKIEKMRRIYAGIHDNWLLIYSNERDCKPLQTFNLKYHTAQNALSKQGKNLEQDFEMVCTYGEKKTYYFTAMTHKDMLQWISHINRCHHKSMNEFKNHNPPPHAGDDDEILAEYDMIDELKFKTNEENKEEEDEEETIYDQIAPVPANPTRVIQNINKPPDLPARRILKPKPPLPQSPPKKEEEELSESSTYDPVDNSNASINNNYNNSLDNSSFSSESESEPIYDTYVNRN